MIVRKAENKDFNKISELYEQVDKIHRDFHPDKFKKQNELGRTYDYLNSLITNDYSILIVSEVDNEVIGFSEGYIMEAPDIEILTPRSWLLIECIAVDERIRRSGAGQKMLDYLINYAKELKLGGVELKVYSFNKNAESFYYKNGFTEISKTLTLKLEK